MDYLPPGRVVKVGDLRWRRWVIVDGLGQVWISKGRWSDDPARAMLFCRELDAVKTKNRYCLGGDEADTFTVTLTGSIAAHARRWSRKTLAAFLNRHRRLYIGGPAGKKGLLLEIVPDTLKKVEP